MAIVRGTPQVDETMTIERIEDMTEMEFNQWFWEPYGVFEHVGLRHRLTEETILKVNVSEWITDRSRSLRDWFSNAAMAIILED